MKMMKKCIPMVMAFVLMVGFCSFATAMEAMDDQGLALEAGAAVDGQTGVYRVPVEPAAVQEMLSSYELNTVLPTKPPSITLNTLPVQTINNVDYVVYDTALNAALKHEILVLVSTAGTYVATWKISTDPTLAPYTVTKSFILGTTALPVPGIYSFYLNKTPTVKGTYGFTGIVRKKGLTIDPKLHQDSCKYVAPKLPVAP